MKFDNVLTQCVVRDLKAGAIPMLLGEPGIGKSSWVEALAKQLRTKCFVLPCNQLADKADLTGARLVPCQTKDGSTTYAQVFYPHKVIHDAIAYAEENPRETPILFMDELNRTTPDVTSECLSIPTLRSIGSIRLPDNLKVITAGNDKGNVTTLDEASVSRFVLYHVVPDVGTFLGLDPDLNVFIKEVLRKNPETIFCKAVVTVAGKDDDDEPTLDEILDEGDGMAQISTPRTIMALSRFLNAHTNQELLGFLATTQVVDGNDVNLLQEIIEAHVGATLFSAKLMEEIVANVQTVAIQTNANEIARPDAYGDIDSCTSMDALDAAVAAMSDNEKSGCLAYALFEKKDNAPVIRALAQATTSFTRDDLTKITKLALDDGLDHDNVAAFMATNVPLANSMAMFFMN